MLAAPGKAESDSYRAVSSAVESLGPSNEHFDQHEQGRKYGTARSSLQCDERSAAEGGAEATRGERSGQGHVRCRSGASRENDGTRETFSSTVLGTCAHIPNISRFFFAL